MRQNKRPRLLRITRVRTRRALARLERRTPLWALLVITPWGISLALHGLFLLLFALYYYAYLGKPEGSRTLTIDTAFASQLTEDLTSLFPAEQAGDPFTAERPAEAPSLSFEPEPADSTRVSVPELRTGMQLGPRLQLEASELVRDMGDAKRDAATAALLATPIGPASAPFAGRRGEARAKLVRREGGTVESERAVELGLDWLARHQKPDGSWSLSTRAQCKGTPPCPDDRSAISDTAATGLALLPMLGAGLTHTHPSRYQDTIKRGLNWLLRHQQKTGDLWVPGGSITHMYSHAIGTMALCEAAGLSHDKRLRDPAQRALNFIINAQNRLDGGWRYEPGAPGDTSVFGWQIFALRSGRLSNLVVPKGTWRGCRTFLDNVAGDDFKTTYAYMPGKPVSAPMTAEALVARQLLGWAHTYPPLVKGTQHVAADLASSKERNIYYWYYATQLLHNMRGKEWERWNPEVRDNLVAMQVGGSGCDRGSWDPLHPAPDRWGKDAGRLYVTSLSLLTLEVYYRYLPLYRDRGGVDPLATPKDPDELADDPGAPTQLATPAAERRKPVE